LAEGDVLVRTYGSTKTSGKFLNKLCLARKAGEGMDRPNTNCLEQFAPPLAPEGTGTRKCLSESHLVVAKTSNSDTLKLSVLLYLMARVMMQIYANTKITTFLTGRLFKSFVSWNVEKIAIVVNQGFFYIFFEIFAFINGLAEHFNVRHFHQF